MQFDRLKLLIGDNFNKIQNSKILILGLGGVGGFAMEALVRCGVGSIIIIDNDNIDITNLNRQIISNHENIGKLKVDEWEERAKKINPDINIIKINDFITKDNISKLLQYDFDFAIDACDTITTKFEFIKLCIQNNKKFISAMGTGKKFHPEKLKVTYLHKTSYDPLAKKLRKLVKESRLNKKVPVISSEEIPIKKKEVNSMITSPGIAGLLIVNYIINEIITLY